MSTPGDVGRAGCEERNAMLYSENIPELNLHYRAVLHNLSCMEETLPTKSL